MRPDVAIQVLTSSRQMVSPETQNMVMFTGALTLIERSFSVLDYIRAIDSSTATTCDFEDEFFAEHKALVNALDD